MKKYNMHMHLFTSKTSHLTFTVSLEFTFFNLVRRTRRMLSKKRKFIWKYGNYRVGLVVCQWVGLTKIWNVPPSCLGSRYLQ